MSAQRAVHAQDGLRGGFPCEAGYLRRTLCRQPRPQRLVGEQLLQTGGYLVDRLGVYPQSSLADDLSQRAIRRDERGRAASHSLGGWQTEAFVKARIGEDVGHVVKERQVAVVHVINEDDPAARPV